MFGRQLIGAWSSLAGHLPSTYRIWDGRVNKYCDEWSRHGPSFGAVDKVLENAREGRFQTYFRGASSLTRVAVEPVGVSVDQRRFRHACSLLRSVDARFRSAYKQASVMDTASYYLSYFYLGSSPLPTGQPAGNCGSVFRAPFLVRARDRTN
jgi:hypothetical protein